MEAGQQPLAGPLLSSQGLGVEPGLCHHHQVHDSCCDLLSFALHMQAYNARRQADLDGLQAEADGVVVHLREQQRGLAARDREADGREKQLALRFVGWLQGATGLGLCFSIALP